MMISDKQRFSDKGYMVAPGFFLTGFDQIKPSSHVATAPQRDSLIDQVKIGSAQDNSRTSAADLPMQSGIYSERDSSVTFDRGFHNQSTVDNLLQTSHSIDQTLYMSQAPVFHPTNLPAQCTVQNNASLGSSSLQTNHV